MSVTMVKETVIEVKKCTLLQEVVDSSLMKFKKEG